MKSFKILITSEVRVMLFTSTFIDIHKDEMSCRLQDEFVCRFVVHEDIQEKMRIAIKSLAMSVLDASMLYIKANEFLSKNGRIIVEDAFLIEDEADFIKVASK